MNPSPKQTRSINLPAKLEVERVHQDPPLGWDVDFGCMMASGYKKVNQRKSVDRFCPLLLNAEEDFPVQIEEQQQARKC